MEDWKKELWKEIILEVEKREKPERLPGEITITEWMEEFNMTRTAAKNFLNTQVTLGRLSKRVVYLLEYKSAVALYLPVKDKV